MNSILESAIPILPAARTERTERTPRWREWHAHAAAYCATCIAVIASVRGRLAPEDALVLAVALASALLVARRWLFLSRIVLAGLALAVVSYALAASGLSGADGPTLLRVAGSSQGQILAMSALALLATGAEVVAFWRRSAGAKRAAARLTVAATTLGFTALLVRWFESYQAGVGHIPISNLYEVFVLFVVITGAIQLATQRDGRLAALGPFLSLAPSAAALFLLWYAVTRGAHELQPLVPALDSYWMKLHVPANFIGYGAFCLAAMVAAASLLTRFDAVARRLPERAVLDEAMHRLVATGFVFFTIATVLGALWAAEAWALIVWLNYAAWLHMRLVKATRGPVLAWWALVGLLVTLFAFLGVNMYLSGLHSYGGL
jgi:cytochrome c-type biogenesis protein CcsB